MDSTPTPRPAQEPGSRRWLRRLPTLAVLTVAVTLAVVLYVRFLGESRRLWDSSIHDRNAHLYSGLCLATDLRHGRVANLFSDLDKFRTWPPFHDGLLVGLSLLLGGGDERWAVLPSLLGWVGTAVFAFLLARRALPSGGTVAGLVAALLVLVSPAQRAFATDVMLESVGACLTLMSLYFYLGVRQNGSARSGWALAATLTALFLHKYNYWGLTVLAIAADRLASEPRRALLWLRERAWTPQARGWLVRQLWQPLNYFLTALVVVIGLIAVTGGATLHLFGKPVSLHSVVNLVTVAYVVAMLRPAVWWWRRGCGLVRQSGPVTRALVYGHAWPIALWFLWPHRLYSFLWVSNPGSNAGEAPKFDLLGGYPFYWSCLASDYHVAAWSVLAVVALLGVTAWAGLRKRLSPGATAVLWLVLVAAVLCAQHPNRKSRFLHSWIPAVWVAAGVGAGCLLRPRTGTAGQVVRVGVAGVVTALAAAHLPGLASPARAPEGGVQPSAASALDLTDSYLPQLADSRRCAVFSNMPLSFLARWTYLQRYGRDGRLTTDVKEFDPGAPDAAERFGRWLAETECDTIVYVDVARGSRFYADVPGCESLGRYGEFLATQQVFRPVHRQALPEHRCVVTVWKRSLTARAPGT